ncbi:holo-ACP synthase [Pseudocitrobacter faecalis]|uniref:holo-ACP synthase n=1 Tax=Pseudocitrobacter faecalis TaxID=1398493 RepID=UPI00389A19BF
MRIGTDIVEIARITRAILNGEQTFYQRVYTLKECALINPDNPDYERASGFWAAKEALVKAIGCGFRDGVRFQDIEITHDVNGAPYFIITGRLQDILVGQGLKNVALSISHCRTHAIATVIVY